MPNIGPAELMIVLAIALIVLGPKRLPEAGRSLGRGIREFRASLSEESQPNSSGAVSSSAATGSPTTLK